jgi:fatty acid desaturase
MQRIDLAAIVGDPARGPAAMRAARAASDGVAWETLVFGAGVTAAFLAMLFLGDRIASTPLKLLLAATAGTWIMTAAFTVMHEAAHGNIFRGGPSARRLNDAAGWLMSFIFVRFYPAFRETHRAHHTHVNDAGADPDFWIVDRRDGRQLWRIACSLFMTRKKTVDYARAHNRPELVQIENLHWIAVFAVFGAASAAIGFADALILWALPWQLAAWSSAYVSAILPHARSAPAPAPQDMKVAIFPRAIEPFIAAVSNGHIYHLLHHAFPTVPFLRYSRVMRGLVEE